MPDADWLQAHESMVRFSMFAGVLLTFAVAEAAWPMLARRETRSERWFANLGLSALSSLLLRIALPGATVLMAVWAQMRGWGLLNQVALPDWLELIVAYLLFDVSIYAQHVLTHRIPILWRLHLVHHADHEVDVTTAIRFHPIEIVLSQILKMGLVLVIGASPVAVIVFEVVLNATAIFNHANLNLGPLVDRIVRSILVTPDMHRIHHSVRPDETNSNYGFSLSLWDRVFGTYRATPYDKLTLGLANLQEAGTAKLMWCLLAPFQKLRSP